MMNPKHLRHVFSRPAGDPDSGGGGGGGTDVVDRGDDFTSTDPDDDAAALAAEAAEAKKKLEDKAAADKAAAAGTIADEVVDDGEQTAEEIAAAAEEAKKPGAKDKRIPLDRHKEILQKERTAREAVEAKLRQYEGGDRIAATNEKIAADEATLLTLEEEYAKHVTDGAQKEAAQTMGKIRLLERGIMTAQSNMAIQAATAQATERVRYDTTVERLEAAYPALNPDHDDFDEVTAKKVVRMKAAYQAEGLTPSEALQSAVKDLMPAVTAKQTTAVDVAPRVDADEVAKRIAAERRQAQVKKNLETAGAQPARTGAVGSDSDKAGGPIDGKAVMRMKYDDFVKLDEATLSKNRGDEL